MNDIEEKLFIALNEVINKQDMRVVNIKIGNKGSNIGIQIIIDSEQGVSLDDCSIASKQTSDLIRLNNYFDQDYDLEVSSPGINRQLFSMNDFELYNGFMVKVKIKKSINNQKNFYGKIKESIGDMIVLECDGNEVKIDFKNIKKANIQEI